MGSSNLTANQVKTDQEVMIVFYTDAEPGVVAGKVTSRVPLIVTTENPLAGKLARQRRAILVRWEDGNLVKTEAEVTAATPGKDCWDLTVAPGRSDELDRRRYPRFNVNVQARVRAVCESDGEIKPVEFQGATVDLSLGGAAVTLDQTLDAQTLVDVTFRLSELESVRCLGVVSHLSADGHEHGIEFLDYIGGARYHLHRFLSEAA